MVRNLIVALLEDDRKYAGVAELLANERSTGIGIPGFVAMGDGRSLYFSRTAESLIWEISRELKEQIPTLSRSHTDKEWHSIVRRSLGPAIAQSNRTLDLESDARAVLVNLREELAQASAPKNSAVSFGVVLFSSPLQKAFQVGPVSMAPRDEWIEKVRLAGQVSDITARRLAQHYSGKKLSKRKNTLASESERDIIDCIGTCLDVCTVDTGGLANSFARTKAIVAAHLALLAFSLTWEQPSSALNGIRLSVDTPPTRQVFLRLFEGRECFSDWHRKGLPHAPYAAIAEWREIFEQQAALRSSAGAVIRRYLSTDNDPRSPDVLTATYHSMLWLYEGCKEHHDPLAVVKFCASMDALSGGKDDFGIGKFLTSRTGLPLDRPLFPGPQSLKSLLHEIYRSRSKIIHGSSTDNRSDVSVLRAKSEKLARMCLIQALDWLSTRDGTASPILMQMP